MTINKALFSLIMFMFNCLFKFPKEFTYIVSFYDYRRYALYSVFVYSYIYICSIILGCRNTPFCFYQSRGDICFALHILQCI